jgi:rubrerythrin
VLAKDIQLRFLVILIGFISAFALLLASVSAQSKYPKTISILQTLYTDEIQALHNYTAYAQKADAENYPNIAKLFVALATSESIHARNFKNLLSDLGVELAGTSKPEIKLSSTKQNLKHATEVELEEIDSKYPQFVEKVRPEKHEAAIRYITYAWESEKQHRDLIKKIQSGTGMLFGLLTKKIEENPADYFVCQNCGSTLTEFPKDICPVCEVSAVQYKKIEMSN